MNDIPTLNKVYYYMPLFGAVVWTLGSDRQRKKLFSRQVCDSEGRGRRGKTVKTVWELSSIAKNRKFGRNVTSKRWEREKRNRLRTPKPKECFIKTFLPLLCARFYSAVFVVVFAISFGISVRCFCSFREAS